MPIILNRRELLQGLAAGSVVAITGCTENPELGRSQFLLVSDAQLAELGAATWTNVKKQERVSSDASLNRRLEKIGTKCVDAARKGDLDWEFAVFDNPEVNAFAIPGGKVGFYSGIFDVMENDDQVATVMGHEVGHVAARHSAERYSQQLAAGVFVTAVSAALATSDLEYGKEIAGVLGAGVTFGVILPYSRQHEYEADALGVRYMTEADYNPNQAVRFWQNMTEQSKRQPLEFMSTHPSDENRIAAIQRQIAGLRA